MGPSALERPGCATLGRASGATWDQTRGWLCGCACRGGWTGVIEPLAAMSAIVDAGTVRVLRANGCRGCQSDGCRRWGVAATVGPPEACMC